MQNPECIVGFSFGRRGKLAGPVNEQLAQNILAYLHEKHLALPLILQQEVALCLKSPGLIKAKIIGEYHTHDVHVQACEAVKQNGWKRCVIAAHKDLIQLCVLAVKKLGIEVVDVVTTAAYDGKSSHLWKRHPLLFKPYIVFATLIYKLKGGA